MDWWSAAYFQTHITTYESDYQYICSECLHAFEKNERPDYCPDCGQHINWEEL